jgi:Raf kinase inhibitor-like YbhB/YbcL family protein
MLWCGLACNIRLGRIAPSGGLFLYLHRSAEAVMNTLKITSPAFGMNCPIPSRYTCDGNDVNPPLLIENLPQGTQSLALIVDDPDAPGGTFVHWVVWNIGPETRAIAEDGVPPQALQGKNDFRQQSYGGPCPPSGTHRYFFKLYALDAKINLGAGAGKAALESAMKGHVLAKTELVGRYTRK